MNEMIQSWRQEPRDRKLQYGCVLLTVLAELIFFTPLWQQTGLAWLAADYFLVIPGGIFLLLALRRGINRKGRAMLVLSLIMVVWSVCVEIFRLLFGMLPIEPGEIACYYGLALPMAYAMEDGSRQRGLNAIGALFVLEGIHLCVLAASLMFGFLPERYSEYVRWDGARLLEMFHPNNCATLLILGMGFCLGLCFRTKKRWLQGCLIVLAAVQFGVQALTNGRTSTGFACMMIGGILFCAIRRTGWKRAPLALAAGIAATAVLFFAAQKLFAVHQQNLTQIAIQASQAEEEEREQTQLPKVNENGKLVTLNGQRSLGKDLFTFNGRTIIWKEAVGGALRHPTILLCGTDSVAEVLAEDGKTNAPHTHNSFLETLYTLGLPGLLLAVAITVLALRAGLMLLWRNTDLWKSSVAMITLCLLGCSLLEPYLFAAKNYHHYLSFFFLTAAGYLHQWYVDSKE
ncbi:MAG: O-antigen ligase family protein [Candidatus Limivicinus sp.]